MKPENIEKINRSFELQAPNFESKSVNFTKGEYLNYTISCVAPCRENTLLEVACRDLCLRPLLCAIGSYCRMSGRNGSHVADWTAGS